MKRRSLNIGMQMAQSTGLDCEQYTYPVGGFLVLQALGIQYNFADTVHCMFYGWCVECIGRDASIRISPHEHERKPTKELYQTHCPESFGSLDQQLQHIGFLMLFLFRDAMVFGIFSGWHFLHLD